MRSDRRPPPINAGCPGRSGRGGGIFIDVQYLGQDTGFATVHPCLPSVPNASSINSTAGVNRPNEIIAELSPAGTVCITIGDATVDLVIDVAGASATGYATVHPCLDMPPTASSINYTSGAVRPNELIARLDAGGGTCITVGDAATHLIVDVTAHDG